MSTIRRGHPQVLMPTILATLCAHAWGYPQPTPIMAWIPAIKATQSKEKK